MKAEWFIILYVAIVLHDALRVNVLAVSDDELE